MSNIDILSLKINDIALSHIVESSDSKNTISFEKGYVYYIDSNVFLKGKCNYPESLELTFFRVVQRKNQNGGLDLTTEEISDSSRQYYISQQIFIYNKSYSINVAELYNYNFVKFLKLGIDYNPDCFAYLCTKHIQKTVNYYYINLTAYRIINLFKLFDVKKLSHTHSLKITNGDVELSLAKQKKPKGIIVLLLNLDEKKVEINKKYIDDAPNFDDLFDNKKYELTDETIFLNETISEFSYKIKLHRIKALRNFGDVKKGDLGGFIENEERLSHKGDCWVYDNAKVYWVAEIRDNARVYDNAKVHGWAKVYDSAQVYNSANVYGDAKIYGNAIIYGNAKVYGWTNVYGNAIINGDIELNAGKYCDNISNTPEPQEDSQKITLEELINRLTTTPESHFSEAEKEILRTYQGNGNNKKSNDVGILWEFYTPDFVCEFMYQLAVKYGYNNGNILEPSCATGNIIRPFVINKNYKSIDAFEINQTSRNICKILYPDVNIYPNYFETAFLEPPRYSTKAKKIWLQNYPYDLVIGNPPYGAHHNFYSSYFTGKDKFKQLEMFFIYKGLELLKTNGLLIYITATNFMSTGSMYQVAKQKIGTIADLVDAYRLPKVFDNTNISTDIIVLKRK